MTGQTDSQSAHFVLGAEAEARTVDPGVRRQILGYNAELMTCRVWFETGARGAPHAHPHSQVTFVEAGRFLFRVGEEHREVGAGDCIFIPPGAVHGADCLEAGVLLDNFSPARADFLADIVEGPQP